VSGSEGLSGVVGAGVRRDSLEALRDLLARTIEDAEPGQVAALSRQLALVLKEIDELPMAKGASSLDQLASRRAARKPRAASQ